MCKLPPKRPIRDKPVLTVQQTADAVDLGRLDRFAQRERRQNRWDPLRNHRFPRARRSDAKNEHDREDEGDLKSSGFNLSAA